MGNQVHTNRSALITVRLWRVPGEALRFSRGGLATLAAAETVRRLGRKGDEVLIHINPKEFRYLIGLWGEPSTNPYTGLPEYGFLSKAFKKIKKAVKDPVGTVKGDFKHATKDLKSVVKSKIFRTVAPILLSIFLPGLGTAIGAALGATGTAASVIGGAVLNGAIGAATGGTKGAIAGALTGGLGGGSGVLAKGIGSSLGTGAAASSAISGALLGGASSKIQGGSFTKGALTGGALSVAAPYLKNALTGSTDPTLTSGLGDDMGGALGGGAGADTPEVPQVQGLEDAAGLEDAVGPPAPPSGGVAPTSGALDYSQGPPAALAGAGAENTFGFDPSSIPAPQAPEIQSTLGSLGDRALAYVKDNPLKVGLGALTLAQGLGRSAPQAAAPQVPQVPLPASFTRPLPIVPFNRTQTVGPVATGGYYTYGSMPEQVWYQQNQLPPPPKDDEEDDGMAMGGMAGGQGPLSMMSQRPWAVNGAGTGRSDEIDAKLSDGEYVIDAETVSMLGDGSTKAGARALDQMRASIRQHKARGMTQGRMSPNARSPLQYLKMSSGGKAKRRAA